MKVSELFTCTTLLSFPPSICHHNRLFAIISDSQVTRDAPRFNYAVMWWWTDRIMPLKERQTYKSSKRCPIPSVTCFQFRDLCFICTSFITVIPVLLRLLKVAHAEIQKANSLGLLGFSIYLRIFFFYFWLWFCWFGMLFFYVFF